MGLGGGGVEWGGGDQLENWEFTGSRSPKTRLHRGKEEFGPAGQVLYQLEQEEDVNPLVSGYSGLKETERNKSIHTRHFLWLLISMFFNNTAILRM